MDPDMILFLLLVLVILIAVTVFGVLVYSGLFTFPEVRTEEPPINYGCTFAYQFLRGPYSSNDVGAAFTFVTAVAPKAPIIGIFYDDPQRVPEDELRCAIGCLINREEVVQAKADSNDVVDSESENVITRLVNEQEEEMLKEKSFRFCHLPRVDLAVVTEFPYTTPFSIWLAPNKVYPRLCDYITAKSLCAYPMMEFYTDDRIRYMAPLSKQDDFFVPEARENLNDRRSSPPERHVGDSSVGMKSGHATAIEELPSPSSIVQQMDARRNPENEDEEESGVRRRRNLPTSVDQEASTMASSISPVSQTSANSFDGERIEISSEEAKRKNSTQSSSSSSFEEIGVEELK